MSKTLSSVFKRAVILKNDAGTIAEGTAATFTFDGNHLIVNVAGRVAPVRLLARRGHEYFGAPFQKTPSLKTLERWSDDGVAKTVTGYRTEPDGHGEDGSPSWLLALGLI